MKEAALILKPILQNDFELQMGADSNEGLTISPNDTFNPIIEQFDRLATRPFFWFIANTIQGITHDAGGHFEQMVTFSADEFVGKPPDLLFKQIHPVDVSAIFAFTNYWITTYLNTDLNMRPYLRPTIYIRLMNPKQDYYWVMVQYKSHIVSGDNKVLFVLTFVTDLSMIKTDGLPMMSIFNTHTKTCDYFECDQQTNQLSHTQEITKISVREIEILKLLSIGYSSKQMANELGISIRTIDNHRQNLLRKTGCKSSSELTSFGIKLGIL